MKKMSPEFTVGLVTIIAIILLLLITLKLENFQFFSNQNTFHAQFDSISGLQTGSSVQVNGVPLGKVSQIKRISGEHPVLVSLSLPRNVDLYSNAVIEITSVGMLGERVISINPGSITTGGRLVPNGHRFVGKPALDLEMILTQTPEIINDLAQIMKAARELITDKENSLAVRQTIQSTRDITRQLQEMLTKSRDKVDSMIVNINETTTNMNSFIVLLNDFVADLKKDLDLSRANIGRDYKAFSQKSQEVLNNVQSMTARLNELSGKINAAMGEGPEAKEILLNISKASDELARFAEGLNKGKGTLGQLATNPGPFENLAAVLERLRSVLEGASASANAQLRYEGRLIPSKSPSRDTGPRRRSPGETLDYEQTTQTMPAQ